MVVGSVAVGSVVVGQNVPPPEYPEVAKFGDLVDIWEHCLELLVLLLKVHPPQLEHLHLFLLAAPLAPLLHHHFLVLPAQHLQHLLRPQRHHLHLKRMVFRELHREFQSVVFLDSGSHFVELIDFLVYAGFWRLIDGFGFGGWVGRGVVG